jgi:hypothetical protein
MKSEILVALLAVAIAAPAFAQEGGAEAATETAGSGVPKAQLPLTLYANAEDEGEILYIPSGWMGNFDALQYDDACADKPHSGASCIKISYDAEGKWAGVVWQDPANDWGDEPGGYDLTGAKRLTFWARGDKGGELVEFKMGILSKNKPFHDSSSAALGKIKLTTDWQQYTIPLEGKNLSCVKTPFVFSFAGKKEPITFYLDDIKYE